MAFGFSGLASILGGVINTPSFPEPEPEEEEKSWDELVNDLVREQPRSAEEQFAMRERAIYAERDRAINRAMAQQQAQYPDRVTAREIERQRRAWERQNMAGRINPWSTPQDSRQKENIVTKTIDLREPIRREISAKYKLFRLGDEDSYPSNANMVVDSFFPAVFHQELGGSEPRIRAIDSRFPSSSVAISRFVAVSLGVKQAHISELCEIIGLKEKYIKDILLAVKRKKIDLALAGFGGTGINFNYWLSELAGWTETVHIFNSIYVFDADKFSLSNLPRIPFYLEESRNTDLDKVGQFDNSRNICSKFYLVRAFIDEENINELPNTTVYYGAPDISTRQLFSEKERILVSATHQDDMCSLDLNPMQNDSIQIETYGKIDLSCFFMNHLVMTIKFLEWLSETHLGDREILTKSEKIMDHTFSADEYTTKKRLYRFPKGPKIDAREGDNDV